MSQFDERLLRIGVFYDGGFFYHVSTYYRYVHERKARISVPGLHEFIRLHAAELEGVDPKYSQIVDSHYFQGRFAAQQARDHDKLYAERAFNDVLMNEGVTTHYLPIPRKTEKGVDVWLSLEAFELAIYKRYNLLVLIAGDSDFLPLVRKVNSLGSRVMVLGWNFEYKDEYGNEKYTITSPRILNEVTYPVLMHELIDDESNADKPAFAKLFLKYSDRERPAPKDAEDSQDGDEFWEEGTILSIEGKFGFIKAYCYENNVFCHETKLEGCTMAALGYESEVEFVAGEDEEGRDYAKRVRLCEM